MAKVALDVVLKDGEDSTVFGNSFASNSDVEVRNPMVSNPTLIGMNVEESYLDTFKSDSRIAIVDRVDEFLVASTGTPPAFTEMLGKHIVTSSGAWDTTQPGSNFIGAQFYYDTDIIPPLPLAELSLSLYIRPTSSAYIFEYASSPIGLTAGASDPTLSVKEGMTLKIYPKFKYSLCEITGTSMTDYTIEVDDRSSLDGSGNGRQDPTINCEVGDTVTFYNTVTYSGHPLYIKTAPTTGTGDQVTTGTITGTGQGFDGTSNYQTLSWDTTGVTPGTYYYQCSNHNGMGGQIIVHASGALSNHPLYIKTAATTGTGDQVTTSTPGITAVSNQGSIVSDDPITVTFGAGSAGTYYYQCSLHAGMGGTINVVASEKNSVGVRTGATLTPDTSNKYSNVTYRSQWTGKHVDIVTMEVGGGYISNTHHVNHPDYDSLTSPGTTRFIPQDWPGLSDTANNQVSDGSEILTSHGQGVLSAAGGTICGFAKHANLYQMSSDGADSFADMYDSLLTWHNAKSVNPTTGEKNPTIAIGEVQWGTWWRYAWKISEIEAIEWQDNSGNWTDAVTRPAGGWGQTGSDLTPFLDRSMIPRQLKDPDTNEWVWVIGVPATYEYNSLNTAMNACLAGGIHCISAASNQGQTFVKNNDPKYTRERLRVPNNAVMYNLSASGSPWKLAISKTTTNTSWPEPWNNYGCHGKTDGIDVAAGQNSEEWSVLDDYTCRGPGIDIIGMGANTFTSSPNTTFADGASVKWGMFSGTSCATPTVVGKAACLIEKYFTYNNEYPTPAQLKSILCQNQYYYGHRSDDTYQKKYIVKSDSTLRSIAGQTGGGIDWTSVPAASGSSFATHAMGNQNLCQLEVDDYVNGGLVALELAGTPRQKANLNVKGFERSQTRGPRPITGGVYPRPRIPRTDTLPELK